MIDTPEQNFIQGLDPGGFHRLVYYRWPSRQQPAATVLCVHGLTRNGRDFDRLAMALAQRLPVDVVAVDIAGRGQSDWLADGAYYNYPQYLADMTALIARLAPKRLFWVGTSMGGMIGLMMAAQKNTPVERLVLNDVGPFVPVGALKRIGAYVGGEMKFAREAEFAAHMRGLYASFGVPDEEGWAHLIAHSQRRTPEGQITYNYDPKIALAFGAVTGDINLWPLWDRITCPVLALRGASSDLFLAETAAEMAKRAPKAQIVVCPESGHAPSLMREHEITAIAQFLQV